MVIGQCGAVLGSHLYPLTESPRYVCVVPAYLSSIPEPDTETQSRVLCQPSFVCAGCSSRTHTYGLSLMHLVKLEVLIPGSRYPIDSRTDGEMGDTVRRIRTLW